MILFLKIKQSESEPKKMVRMHTPPNVISLHLICTLFYFWILKDEKKSRLMDHKWHGSISLRTMWSNQITCICCVRWSTLASPWTVVLCQRVMFSSSISFTWSYVTPQPSPPSFYVPLALVYNCVISREIHTNISQINMFTMLFSFLQTLFIASPIRPNLVTPPVLILAISNYSETS